MRELIQERREEIERGERGSDDLFASLVRASSEENDNGEPVLGDRELLGNTFVFLLAGALRSVLSRLTTSEPASSRPRDDRPLARPCLHPPRAQPGRPSQAL